MRLITILLVGNMLAGVSACKYNEPDSSYFPLPEKPEKVINSEAESFMVDTVVTGLERPWSMVFLPDKTVLIAERSGKLLMVKNGLVQKEPIGGKVPKGLRDIKLHPDFAENGWLYLSYYIEPTTTAGGYTALLRGKLKEHKLVDTELLYKAGPFKEGGEWYGSKIAFDPAGYLYYTVGIRGDRKNAQDMANSSGKTLRLNADGTIPADNPFVNTPGSLPEIYTYGHRMHEGLALDSKTGQIWSTEFGELGGDEVNVLKAGANYGWPEVTFSLEYSGKKISSDSVREDVETPVHHWKNAPSDMDFVHGSRYPNWAGNLFIGGLGRRLLLRLVLDRNKVVHEEMLLENIGRVRDVKFAPDKFLYLLTEDTGLLVRLIPAKSST